MIMIMMVVYHGFQLFFDGFSVPLCSNSSAILKKTHLSELQTLIAKTQRPSISALQLRVSKVECNLMHRIHLFQQQGSVT